LRVTKHRKLALFDASHFAFEYVSQTSSQFFTKLSGGGRIASCDTSQISERVTGEGSFAKGFAMSSDSQNTINPLNHYYNLFCLGRELGENDQLEFGHKGARRRVASFLLSDVFCVGLKP
jgi:hypothetical protein